MARSYQQARNTNDMNNLIERANKLYEYCGDKEIAFDDSLILWKVVFTDEELIELDYACKNDLDLSFDDEVYEAIKNIINH